ncbi:glutamate-cysteine ligase family protein [Streptomyces flaveolus]|uniref:glutamate-cysteine ligase family protein n=1 Tax=Streptomyces flaveolus TaxID=67297 RepID=UPI00342F4E6C
MWPWLSRYRTDLLSVRRPHHPAHLSGSGGWRTAFRAAALGRAAARHGLRITSSGSPITGLVAPVPLTPGPRSAQSLSLIRALDDEQSACACHVHVGVADPREAIEVSNDLRTWLAKLTALAANRHQYGALSRRSSV